MKKKTIYLNNQLIELQPSQLIQSGGEGMIFQHNQSAIKIYHAPTAAHQAKLNALANANLAHQLPKEILFPQQLVYTQKGKLIGFQMNLLPPDTLPIRQLSNANYCQKNKIGIPELIDIFSQLHQTITLLHKKGVIIGDLNDHNIFFRQLNNQFELYWLDVDSYQFQQHPCPVAMHSFLDPNLYQVGDLSRHTYFTELTDWYAYFVMLSKSFLFVHPYGGMHHQYKSLISRAEAKISCLDSSVTYPKRARPGAVLTDQLRQHFQTIFGSTQRIPFPQLLLTQYQSNLIQCTQCPESYPRQQPHCPICSAQAPTLAPVQQFGSLIFRQLFETARFIEQLLPLPHGRFMTISRQMEQNQHSFFLNELGVGGSLKEIELFSSSSERSNYTFRWFDNHLVINPHNQTKLLMLNCNGAEIIQTAVLETELFKNKAVFATTPKHLYRISGNYLIKSSFQYGQILDEIAATIHRNQTEIWGSPYQEHLFIHSRLFAEHLYFFLDEKGKQIELNLPPLQPGDSLRESAVHFSSDQKHLILLQQFYRQNQLYCRTILLNQTGKLIHTSESTLIDHPHLEHLNGQLLFNQTLLSATDHGILKQQLNNQTMMSDAAEYSSYTNQLHFHPQGILIQNERTVWLASPS